MAKRARKPISRQMMQNRILRARMLHNSLNELHEAIQTPNLPVKVKSILEAQKSILFSEVYKAQRKVIVAVQKVLVPNSFETCSTLFDANRTLWIDDPSMKVIEDGTVIEDDDEDEEDDSAEGEITQESLVK